MSDRDHELLPWYLNGTLEPAEREAFDRHLEACAPCRSERGVIETIKAALQRHGESFLGDHVSPETLVSLWMTGDEPLSPEQEAAARRHVSLCATCTEESRWLRKDGIPGAVPVRASAAADAPAERRLHGLRDWRTIWRWGATAAAVILALVLVGRLHWNREAGGLTPPPHLLEAEQRAAAGGTVLLVTPQETRLRLILETDLESAARPLSLEIMGPGGALVYRRNGIMAPDLLSDRFLLLDFERRIFPDGDYVLRVIGASGRAEERTEYPFRVVTQHDAHR